MIQLGASQLDSSDSSRTGARENVSFFQAHGQLLGAHPVEAKIEVEALGIQSCEVHESASRAMISGWFSMSSMGFHTRAKPKPWKSRTFAVASSVTP